MGRFTGLLGILTFLALAYLFSTNRKAIRLKTVLWGLGLQLTFAIFVLRFESGRALFAYLGAGANKLLSFAFYGPASAAYVPSASSMPNWRPSANAISRNVLSYAVVMSGKRGPNFSSFGPQSGFTPCRLI